MSKHKTSIYAGMTDFSADLTSEFDRARTGMATPFLSRVLDLSVARTNEMHNVSGNFLYADIATTGTAIIELNNQMDAPDAPITFAAGFGVECPFKQLKISNQAQPGKQLILIYGAGDGKIIPSSSLLNINQIIQPVNISPVAYAASWDSKTPLAAAGVATVVTPAQNVNGVIINRAFQFINCGSSATPWTSMLAKATTPASEVDGDLLMMADGFAINGTNVVVTAKIENPLRIPPGKGVYFYANTAEGWVYRSVMYTVL